MQTVYRKLRIGNWIFLVLLSLIALSIYSYDLVESEEDISRSNESKVLEIIGLSTCTILLLALDLHFYAVVAYHFNQLGYMNDRMRHKELYGVHDTESHLN